MCDRLFFECCLNIKLYLCHPSSEMDRGRGFLQAIFKNNFFQKTNHENPPP